ncbi:unnamed protein product [Rangifer tarandus platyrhynchus]|uniref:Uncharacterized protein n=1 Tax=Rangifer tarandus platyrhynchus TaxID=3082113 RepID=A0ACB1KHB4_RANTA
MAPGYLAQVESAPPPGPLEKKEALAHGFPGPVGGCQRVYRIGSLADFREKSDRWIIPEERPHSWGITLQVPRQEDFRLEIDKAGVL